MLGRVVDRRALSAVALRANPSATRYFVNIAPGIVVTCALRLLGPRIGWFSQRLRSRVSLEFYNRSFSHLAPLEVPCRADFPSQRLLDPSMRYGFQSRQKKGTWPMAMKAPLNHPKHAEKKGTSLVMRSSEQPKGTGMQEMTLETCCFCEEPAYLPIAREVAKPGCDMRSRLGMRGHRGQAPLHGSG